AAQVRYAQRRAAPLRTARDGGSAPQPSVGRSSSASPTTGSISTALAATAQKRDPLDGVFEAGTSPLPKLAGPAGTAVSVAAKAPFVGVPGVSLGNGLKGREKALYKLNELLVGGDKVALTSAEYGTGRVYAHGGGGIGKSRLAIEYVWRYQSEFPGGVFYASAVTRRPLDIWAEFGREIFSNGDSVIDDE